MTARSWLYSQLMAIARVDGRVFAKKSMISSRAEHPYIVYKLGNNTAEGLAEDVDPARQFVQIFVHDFSDGDTADYGLIDEVLRDIKNQLRLASSAEDGVIAVRYLETSQDLNDETLNTVMKYIRYQLILED